MSLLTRRQLGTVRVLCRLLPEGAERPKGCGGSAHGQLHVLSGGRKGVSILRPCAAQRPPPPDLTVRTPVHCLKAVKQSPFDGQCSCGTGSLRRHGQSLERNVVAGTKQASLSCMPKKGTKSINIYIFVRFLTFDCLLNQYCS